MDNISALLDEGREAVQATESLEALDEIRVRYLGKKGALTQQLKQLGSLPAEERPAAGQAINKAKQDLQQSIEARRETLESLALEKTIASQIVDVTLPGRGQTPGGPHPVTRTMNRMEEIFRRAGFGDVPRVGAGAVCLRRNGGVRLRPAPWDRTQGAPGFSRSRGGN